MAFDENLRRDHAGDAQDRTSKYLAIIEQDQKLRLVMIHPDSETERMLECEKIRLEYERYFNEDFSKAVKFSVASSLDGGIKVCFDTLDVPKQTIHVPKHCSVHHLVVQMVLSAAVLQDTFYSPRSIVPKAILDIISEAGWGNWLSLPVPFDMSVETRISKTLGPVNSVRAQEPKDQHYILMNPGNEQNDLPCELDQPIHCSKHPDANEILTGDTKPAHLRVGEGTQLNSSGCGGKWHDSKMYVLVAPQSLTPSDGSSYYSTGNPAPLLLLDSGAFHHVVGDAGILTDLRDPPARTLVTLANGAELPVTKVGVIQAPDIKISDVYLVPGLETNLVSVSQLAKSKIFTTFYENHAELLLDGERIGGAIVDNNVYRLRFFKPHA